MAAAAAGLGVLGTVGQTTSNVMAADVNAKALQAEARGIEQETVFRERQLRRETALARGKAIAIGAASGVDLTSGSPLLMELDRVKQSEIEALSLRRSGQMAASSKRFEARMVRRSIPGLIFGGVAQSGSILSQYAGRGGSSGGSGFGAEASGARASTPSYNWYGGTRTVR